MNARTNIQIINGPDGAPAFVVIPYAEYVKQRGVAMKPTTFRMRLCPSWLTTSGHQCAPGANTWD